VKSFARNRRRHLPALWAKKDKKVTTAHHQLVRLIKEDPEALLAAMLALMAQLLASRASNYDDLETAVAELQKQILAMAKNTFREIPVEQTIGRDKQ
jgi:hypothetical protein